MSQVSPDNPTSNGAAPSDRQERTMHELKAKDVLTTGEVAKICNVAPRTVSKWFDAGSLKGYRIPGSKDRRIPLNQLVRFMKEHDIPLNGLKTGNTRVLLVNNEPDLNDVLEKILEDEARYEVEVATNAFAAGLAAERSQPHVMLVDLHLPGLDPHAVADLVRQSPDLQLTKLIAMSDHLDDLAGGRLTRQGFDAFLRKPFHVRRVIEAVEQVTQITY
jgi:excisionase family DNA binding protein